MNLEELKNKYISRGYSEKEAKETAHLELMFKRVSSALSSEGIEIFFDSQAGSWGINKASGFPEGLITYASPYFDGRKSIYLAHEDLVEPSDQNYTDVEEIPFELTYDLDSDVSVYLSVVTDYLQRLKITHFEKFSKRFSEDSYLEELFTLVQANAPSYGLQFTQSTGRIGDCSISYDGKPDNWEILVHQHWKFKNSISFGVSVWSGAKVHEGSTRGSYQVREEGALQLTNNLTSDAEDYLTKIKAWVDAVRIRDLTY